MNKYFISTCLILISTLLGQDYSAKDYSYLIDRMPKFDAKILEIHFSLYRGYVEQANRLSKLMKEEMEKSGGDKSFTYQAIKRRFGWEYDGMVLHELYFDNLGGSGSLQQRTAIQERIIREFGSYKNWVKDFKGTAMTRGVGWVILYWDPTNDSLYNAWIGEHDEGLLVGQIPLLVVDLWEHAYLCQFRLDRGRYLDVVFGYLDWNVVNRRLEDAIKCAPLKEKD